MSRRGENANAGDLATLNQVATVIPRKQTTTVRIYLDTKIAILAAISAESVRNANGTVTTNLAEIVDIAISKLLGVKLVPDFDRRLMIDYGFSEPEQLAQYNATINLVPKELRTIELRRTLRQVIIQGKVMEFLATLDKPAPVVAPEEF